MTSRREAAALPPAVFAFPGPLRQALNTAIMDGSKTTTTALLLEYELEGEPLPAAGRRQRLLGSGGEAVAVIETTGHRVVRLAEVPLEHVLGEGEGHTDVADWRRDHEQFWRSAAFRESVGEPEFRVQDDTLVILETLRCLEVLDGAD